MADKISELQAQQRLVELQTNKSMLEQIDLKRKLLSELEAEPGALREQELNDAVAMIDANLQRFRVEGLL